MTAGYPEIPEDSVPSGWEHRDRSEDRLFQTLVASVTGKTILYVETEIERALDESGILERLPSESGSDRLLETETIGPFCFATALSFRPPLAPGVGPATLRPMVESEARRAFAADLRSRGFDEVDEGSRQRVRTQTGDRARLWKYAGTHGTDDGVLSVEGWLGVWVHEGSFRIAGGAYPTSGIDAEIDPRRVREELIGLVRAVR